MAEEELEGVEVARRWGPFQEASVRPSLIDIDWNIDLLWSHYTFPSKRGLGRLYMICR